MVISKKFMAISLCLLSISAVVAATVVNEKSNSTESTASDTAVPLAKHYDNKQSKYSIKYPADWIIDDSEAGAVIFSGKKETPAYYSTVNIQAILSKKRGGEYANLKAVVDDIKKQVLAESPKTTFLSDGPYEMMTDKGKIKGHSLVFIYSYQGNVVEQWQIVIPREGDSVFYTWAYTAPIGQYNDSLPIAKAMLATWTLQ